MLMLTGFSPTSMPRQAQATGRHADFSEELLPLPLPTPGNWSQLHPSAVPVKQMGSLARQLLFEGMVSGGRYSSFRIFGMFPLCSAWLSTA